LTIWQEQLSASEDRNYAIALQPANPPAPTSTKNMNSPRGISILAFSADRSFLATKHDLLPTTVWIWSLHAGTSVAVLIHHSPVKNVAWHPTEADLLLVHCAIPQPCVHLWKSTWEAPRIVTLPLRRTGGKLEANWLLNPASSEYNILLSSAHQYTTALLSSSGEISPRSTSDDEVLAKSAGIGAEALFDEGNSFDLSPIKITRDETIGLENENEASGLDFSMGNEMVDDTFHYRRHARAIG